MTKRLSRRAGRDLCDTFVDTAMGYIGYTALGDRNSLFGERVGHRNQGWSGSFVDVVAREAGVQLPSCVYAPAALAEFFHVRAIHERPEIGDLAFFAASTDAAFGAPAVGIVSAVHGWDADQQVSVISGQTATGLMRGSQESNGVYERNHYRSDLICFARPDFRRAPQALLGDMEAVPEKVLKVGHFAYMKRSPQVELVQAALAQVLPGVQDFERGVYDAKTRSAFARYQRSIGYVGATRATGLPDENSLSRLSEATGLFRI